MGRIVIRCQHTGHYVLSATTTPASSSVSGRMFCPYCEADHVWQATEAKHDDARPRRSKALVRQAS